MFFGSRDQSPDGTADHAGICGKSREADGSRDAGEPGRRDRVFSARLNVSPFPAIRMGPMSDIILVAGGAGFIGSALVRHLIDETDATVVNLDKLTYAANLENLASVE